MTTMISVPEHGLTFGDLALVADGQPVVHRSGDYFFTTEVSSDGTTWGNPEVVVSSLLSEISDGELVTQTHTGNREPVLYVRLSSDTHAGLVAGDTALGAVVGPPRELAWQPPDALAPPTVIDVVWSKMDHQWDDWDELNRRRVWVVSMAALPWPRSATKVMTPAVATTTPTVIDSGSSLTNWTYDLGSPVLDASQSVVSGAVTTTLELPQSYSPTRINIVRGFPTPLSMLVNKYVAFDWKSSLAPAFIWGKGTSDARGAFEWPEAARTPGAAAGYTRSWFHALPATAWDTVELGLRLPSQAESTEATISIDQVLTANALPSVGTSRQQVGVISPGGSVPAEGTVNVEHNTAGLGQAIVFTHPARGGYLPALRQFLVTSNTVTTDATTVSGAHNQMDVATVYRMPISTVPRGDHQLWARLGFGGIVGPRTIKVFWAADSWVSGTRVGDQQNGSIDLYFPAADTYYLFPLARLTLPPVEVGPSGYIQIGIQKDANFTGVLFVDEAWSFAMDEGQLTVVDCGTGTPAAGTVANRLRVTAPSLEAPHGRIDVATASDWSDAYAPPASRVLCDQTGHRFAPEGSIIHTVASGATNAAVSLEHYRRWRFEAGS